MKKKGLVLFLLSALLFTACGTEKNKTEETDKLTVVTSFYPVYLLAQEIVQGAEGIRLENMAQPQTGCLHDYELSISDMKLLETADIFIINGGGMELGLWAVVMIIGIHMIETYVLNPRIVSSVMHINPVMTLIILYIAHSLIGMWGMLLGVPVAVYVYRKISKPAAV